MSFILNKLSFRILFKNINTVKNFLKGQETVYQLDNSNSNVRTPKLLTFIEKMPNKETNAKQRHLIVSHASSLLTPDSEHCFLYRK